MVVALRKQRGASRSAGLAPVRIRVAQAPKGNGGVAVDAGDSPEMSPSSSQPTRSFGPVQPAGEGRTGVDESSGGVFFLGPRLLRPSFESPPEGSSGLFNRGEQLL